VKEAADLLRALTQNLGAFAANANLTALAAAVGAANKGLMFTGPGAIGTFDLSAQGRALVAASTQAAQRASLGLGTASVLNANAFAQSLLNAATLAEQRTALGLTPTISAQDTTVGRLIKVGDFNLGRWDQTANFGNPQLGSRFIRVAGDGGAGPINGIAAGLSMAITDGISAEIAGRAGNFYFQSYGESTPALNGWQQVWTNRNLLVSDRSLLTSLSVVNDGQVATVDKARGLFSAYSTSSLSADWNLNIDPGTSDRLMNAGDANGPGFGSLAYAVTYRYSEIGVNGNLTQLAIGYATGAASPKLGIRGRYQGAWSRWAEFWSTENLTPNKLEDRTLTTLPSAGANKGQMFLCTNTPRGNRPVYSDGSNWLKIEDNTLATAA